MRIGQRKCRTLHETQIHKLYDRRETRKENTERSHPRSPKDVPLLDLEVLAKALDVLDQVPGRVLLEARAPAENTHTLVDGSELVALWSDARRGLSGSALI